MITYTVETLFNEHSERWTTPVNRQIFLHQPNLGQILYKKLKAGRQLDDAISIL